MRSVPSEGDHGVGGLATTLTDAVFGAVTIRHDAAAGRVAVHGEGLPEVVVHRTPDVPLLAWVPIGTRDPTALALSVAGARQELHPAKGGLTRRSYRVRARVGTTDLLFAPSSPSTSRLVRGLRHRGDDELGTFERVDGEVVPAVWSQDQSLLGVTATGPRPEPEEAAVGYALAAAFGTGAQFFLAALLDGAGRAMPV